MVKEDIDPCSRYQILKGVFGLSSTRSGERHCKMELHGDILCNAKHVLQHHLLLYLQGTGSSDRPSPTSLAAGVSRA